MLNPSILAVSMDEDLPLKPLEFLVLASLLPGPLHGYRIATDVNDRTSGRVKLRPGNLYRVLDRMLERGLIDVAERRKGDERRTYYRITPAGKRAAAAEAEMLASVAAEVQFLLPEKA
jgi:DNA-binding PadR family transcriptional regulator